MSVEHNQPANILIIEDNPADVIWLRHALDQQGHAYALEVVPDGEAALRFVDDHRTGARTPEPCVILLDLYLPKYDGIAVLRAIKAAPRLAHIQVMVMSSLPAPRDLAAILDLDAICRIKPSTLKDCMLLASEIFEICRGLRLSRLAHAAP